MDKLEQHIIRHINTVGLNPNDTNFNYDVITNELTVTITGIKPQQ